METAVSIGVLAALLYLITRPPRPWPEVVWAVPAAALVLVTGLEPWSAAWQQVRALWPTLAFLAAIFVVAEGADAAGLFDAAGSLLGRGRLHGRAGQRRTVVAVAVLAVVITSVLSLDATVVLFTPVVVRAVRGRGRPTVDAALLATVFLANGASLLSPVANLTNLLVIHQSGLSYAGFSARLALPCLVAGALITWVVLAGNREPAEPVPAMAGGRPEALARTVDALGWFVVAVIAVLVVRSSSGRAWASRRPGRPGSAPWSSPSRSSPRRATHRRDSPVPRRRGSWCSCCASPSSSTRPPATASGTPSSTTCRAARACSRCSPWRCSRPCSPTW